MHDLDDGLELEHLGTAASRSGSGTAVAVAVVLVSALALVAVVEDRTLRPPSPCRSLSIRSWGVVGVEERAPVVFAVVDVPAGASIVRLGVDGGQDTAPVVNGHAVVAVPLSTARLRGASGGQLSAAALADVGAVPVIARDADGWAVARAPIGLGC
jgi:hypothetical protein